MNINSSNISFSFLFYFLFDNNNIELKNKFQQRIFEGNTNKIIPKHNPKRRAQIGVYKIYKNIIKRYVRTQCHEHSLISHTFNIYLMIFDEILSS